MPRKYSAILRFEDWQFYDDIDGNNWTVFGDRDIVRFTEDSPFNDVCNLQRNYMTIYNCNGYLYNDQDMYVARTSLPSSPDVDKENVFCFKILVILIEWHGR